MRDEMRQSLDKAFALGAAGIVDELVKAGLRDRDHESCSTGARVRLHAESVGPGGRLICECVDHEPDLEINRHLTASQPEALVEGALITARAISPSSVVFHVADEDEAGRAAIATVVEHATQDTSSPVPPGTSLTIERGPFRQNLKGYEDVPTLVVNAETLANIARVFRDGVRRYRESGTADSPGTKLFQVSGGVGRPGIYELPLGTTLRRLLLETCGGIDEDAGLQAVLVGGARGRLYREGALDLALDFDSVERSGGVIGTGAVMVLTGKDCVIDQTRRQISVACSDACGKCSLGREGTYQLREIITDMTAGKSRPADLQMLREICHAMQLGCACVLCRTAPNAILSGMDEFAEEYEAHMKRRRCKALVCAQYVTFHVLPELCDGCGACAAECPEDAIAGGRNKIHVIDQDVCEKCGRCYEVCQDLREAVVKAGPVKPRTPKRPIPVGSWDG